MQIIPQSHAVSTSVLSRVGRVFVFSADKNGWVDCATWEAIHEACQQRREILLWAYDGALHRWHELLFMDSRGRTPERYVRVTLRVRKGSC